MSAPDARVEFEGVFLPRRHCEHTADGPARNGHARQLRNIGLRSSGAKAEAGDASHRTMPVSAWPPDPQTISVCASPAPAGRQRNSVPALPCASGARMPPAREWSRTSAWPWPAAKSPGARARRLRLFTHPLRPSESRQDDASEGTIRSMDRSQVLSPRALVPSGGAMPGQPLRARILIRSPMAGSPP